MDEELKTIKQLQAIKRNRAMMLENGITMVEHSAELLEKELQHLKSVCKTYLSGSGFFSHTCATISRIG